MLFVLILGSYCVGLGEAKRQRNFLVIAKDSLVVLRIYGDRAICASLKTDTHRIEPSFLLRNIDKGTDTPWELRAIGPLGTAEERIK